MLVVSYCAGCYQPLVFDTFAGPSSARRATIETTPDPDDQRLAALGEWISGIDAVAGSVPEPASSDASFRRYFRLRKGARSFIVMDSPPENEDCLPFLQVAGYFEAMRLNAPRILEINLDDGFLLLSDLGTRSYLEALGQEPDSASLLYNDAIRALLRMQQQGVAFQNHLPPYDEELLRFELSLFHDWLCGTHLAIEFTDDEEQRWQQLCDLLVVNALDQPQVFVHRDYHSRNLMLMDEDNPGILDFQDAVEGPLTYDLVSLLKDCYVKWPADQVWQWAQDFHGGLEAQLRQSVGEIQFRRYFELMGVQRHLKAAGIFARLCHRDGKSVYLGDVPRALSYITDLAPDYPELASIAELIETQVLPGLAR